MDAKTEDILSLTPTTVIEKREEELHKLLEEVRNEIEENEMVHGIPIKVPSTVPLPKDSLYFKKERRKVLERMLSVSEAKPVLLQADVLKEEAYNCLKPEYTTESLPLLLHDYFVTRIGELVQAKYLHMLRWKRFCEHSSAIEQLYPYYQKRISLITAEYKDCIERARRLAAAKEAVSQGSDFAAQSVHVDDLMIYLRWLICQMSSVKRLNQYLTVLQWFHVAHKNDVALTKESTKDDAGQQVMNKFSSRYDDVEATAPNPSYKSTTNSKTSKLMIEPMKSSTAPQPPPLVNPQLFSSSPVQASAFINAAAAAGGGISSDEAGCLPFHCNDFQILKPHVTFFAHLYDVESNIEEVITPADEMEMYASVLRVFKKAFSRQEAMKTFKVYDGTEVGSQNWGADHSMHALKKECNWLEYVTFKLDVDPDQEKEMVQLRHKNQVDELLRTQSKFLQINDVEKVKAVLKAHSDAVRSKPLLKEVSVRNNKTANSPLNKLQEIYCNVDNIKSDSSEDMASFDPRDVENVTLGNKKGKHRKESYDYMDTVQMLGLDEGGSKDENTSGTQGGYLSFLYLRHLRIRDLQRTCLSILNYFRSVERTTTINVNGLAHENGNLRVLTPLGHKTNNASENCMSAGLNSHSYLYNSPAEYKIAESEFMEFTEVDNHDDFYSFDEGRVHVQDQRGYYIMYEEALNDLKALEADLLLVASHYIEKDTKLRTASRINKASTPKARDDATSGSDIFGYSHREVDRFDVLLDLWTNEACYLENKRVLLDCYMEAYHHVFNHNERNNLAQTMFSIMRRRPRFDFTADYFLKAYKLESVCLRMQASLVKSILDNQIEESRQYTQRVCRDVEGNGEVVFGLPFPVIPYRAISLNMSLSALKNVYILEYHPSLALAAKLPVALSHALCELKQVHKPVNVTEVLEMEVKTLELAQQKWESLPMAGSKFAPQIQKELFSGVFVDDPLFLCEVARSLVETQDQQDSRKTKKERQAMSVKTVGKVMELVTLRHRLMEATWETEVLSDLYKQLAREMKFDECHLYMRFLQFDYAVYKEGAGKPPPLMIAAVQDDDSSVDRLIPKDMPLSIHELDENGIGRFTFRSREGVMNLLKSSGLENFRITALSQVIHKNGLIAAVQQAYVCGVHMKTNGEAFDMEGYGRMSPTDTKSEKSSLTMLTGFSGATKGEPAGTSTKTKDRSLRSPESFVSLQLEKTPFRDLMLNEFIEKKRSMGMILRNPEEADKLKRQLILTFNQRFCDRILQYSLRGQIIDNYNGILNLLQQFTNIRDNYFILGDPNEKKEDSDSVSEPNPDQSETRRRPSRVLSEDGESLLNLWFIPHHSEILLMFKELPQEQCVRALTLLCQITASLHDIMQYLCAHSKLGSGQAMLGSQKVEFVSADWGGTEGIGAELREIQKQINNLINPLDPGTISKFLQLRRDVMFLTMDTAVRYSMRDTFLSSNNSHAYQAVTNSLHFALPHMSNETKSGLINSYMAVPEPLEAHDAQAKALYPWRSFINRNGPFSTMLWQSHRISHNMQTCLCGLKDVDRHVANGEILGVSLLLEDILQSGNQDSSTFLAIAATADADDAKSKKSGGAGSRPASSFSILSVGRSDQQVKSLPISKTKQPIEAYELLKHFLLLWKRTEVLKTDWSLRRLQVQKLDTPTLHKLMCKEYKEQKLFPVLQSLARRTGHSDLYEGITHDHEPLVMPPNVSEIEIKAAQLLKLVESLEEHMILETVKKLTKDLNLAYAERGREEGALPTDLWKKPTWKENFTIARPEIAERFTHSVLDKSKETEDEYIIPKKVWDDSIKVLTCDVLAREKFDYESYTSYYESLMKVTTQLLYNKEQEIRTLKDRLNYVESNITVEVQCQLADKNHELIMEVTGLRAQIAELKKNAATQEDEIRAAQREEYDGLVRDLYNTCNVLRKRLYENKEEIYAEISNMITESSRETDQAIEKKLPVEESEDEKKARREQKLRIERLTSENFELLKIQSRMKVMSAWKYSYLQSVFNSQLRAVVNEKERNKKLVVRVQINAEQEIILLRQQILALRKALTESEREAGEMRKKLDKELKVRKEKSYSAMQQAANQRQLELAKAANVEKLLEELEEKERLMKRLALEQERNSKLHHINQEKAKKDVTHIKKQLIHERTLKLDAFQRVDELQSLVYDKNNQIVRAHTVLGTMNGGAPLVSCKARSANPSRIKTAHTRDNQSTVITMEQNNAGLQRPKTTTGRLRSRVAEQLLNDIERDPQETFETVRKLQREKSAAFLTQ